MMGRHDGRTDEEIQAEYTKRMEERLNSISGFTALDIKEVNFLIDAVVGRLEKLEEKVEQLIKLSAGQVP